MNRAKRPDIAPLPLSRLDVVLEVLAVLLLLSIWGNLLYHYAVAPDSVPTHFNGRGEPDGFGNRTALLLLPGIALLLYVSLTVVSRLPSRYFNLPVATTESNAPKHYALARQLVRIAKVYALTLFSYITWAQVQTALGVRAGLGRGLMPAMLLGVLVMLGFYFAQARRIR